MKKLKLEEKEGQSEDTMLDGVSHVAKALMERFPGLTRHCTTT